MMPRVLVTGATGFLGRHTVPRLLAAGYPLTLVTRRKLTGQIPNADIVRCDLTNPRDVKKHAAKFRRCPIVVHLAVNIPATPEQDRDIKYCFDDGVALTRNLLEVMRPEHIVFGSTIDVYGSIQRIPIDENHPLGPRSYYAAAKLASEALLSAHCARHAIPLTILRFSQVYGPWDPSVKVIPRTIRTLIAGGAPVLHGGGTDTRDHLYVSDAAESIIRAIGKRATGVFNIGTGTENSIRDTVLTLINASGSNVKPELKGEEKPPSRMYFDVSRARDQLGFAASMDLRSGLQRTVQRFRPTIALDLDGTLLDVKFRYHAIHRDLLKPHKTLDLKTYWKLKRQGVPERQMLAKLKVPGEQIEHYLRRRMELIETESYVAMDRLVAGVKPTLRILARDYNLVLVTNRHNHAQLHRQLDNLGIREYFKSVLTAESTGEEQIAARKAELVRELDADILAVVGDTRQEVLAARMLKAIAVVVSYGIREPQALKRAKPDSLITRINELPATLERLSQDARITFRVI